MTHKTIAVIDYGMGNLHSVAKALQHVAPKDRIIISSDRQQIEAADSVVLPGVGAIRDCMAGLHDTGLADVVKTVSANKPFLGICIGMQTLMNRSEENGGVPCLGIIDGDVQGFGFVTDDNGLRLKVPHMGWNEVSWQKESALLASIAEKPRYYFVHSYFVECNQKDDVLGTTHYGQDFVAAFQHESIIGMQFHPESVMTAKGMEIVRNVISKIF